VADLLENAAGWLGGMRAKYLSRTVTYQRDTDSVDVAATVGKTEFQIDSGYGVIETFQSRDFLIAAAGLVLDDQAVLPEPGDRITETQGEQTFVYEVMAPGNEPCWRYSDVYRQTLRIHTKQVGVE
jgi:hypothetical protein